jgi:DNA polymerase III sliding clamp (beta) subunit (PCNA family)
MDISFTLERDALEKAVSKIITVCERASSEGSNSLPYFFHIRIDGYGEALKLSAGNAVRSIEVLLSDVSRHEPFCFGVNGSYFHGILKALPSGKLTFDVKDACYMHNGASTLKFQMLSASDFPSEDERGVHEWWETDYGELFSRLKKVIYCVDFHGLSGKSYVKAVHVSPQNFLCTDNRRLSLVPNGIIPYEGSFLLPAESVQSFSSLFDASSPKGFVYVDGFRMHFSQGSVHASTRLLCYDAPDFEKAIPKGAALVCSTDREPLLMSLKRAIVVARKGQSKDRLQPVCLAFSTNRLRLFLENQGFAISDNLDIAYSGPDMELHLDLGLLHQALKNIAGEVVKMEIRGENTPIVLADSERSHINVIMPVVVRR